MQTVIHRPLLVPALALASMLMGLGVTAQPPADAGLKEALAAYEAAQFERSEVLLRRLDLAALNAPDRILYYQYLGVLLYSDGRFEQAEEAFASLLELDPQHLLRAPTFSPELRSAFDQARERLTTRKYIAGLEALIAQRLTVAQAELDLVLRLAPNHAKARTYLELARVSTAEAQPPAQPTKPFSITRFPETRYRYDVGQLRLNEPVYLDRCYLPASLPRLVADQTLLRTANDDKTRTDSLIFRVSQAVDLFVAADARSECLPDWLASFSDTGERITLSSGKGAAVGKDPCAGVKPATRLGAEELGPSFTYKVYQRRYAEGVVTLKASAGSAKPGHCNMYFVVLRQLSAGQP